MPKLKKIILTFFTILIFLFLPNRYIASAYLEIQVDSHTILDGGFDVLPDNNGNFLILSYDKNSTKTNLSYLDTTSTKPIIKQLNFSNNRQKQENIDHRYITANYFNNFLYLTHNDGQKTTVEKYEVNPVNDSYTLSLLYPLDDITIKSINQIALGINGNIFILKQDGADCVKLLTDSELSDSKLTQTGQTFHFITTDISKSYLYALNSSNKLLRYDIASNNYTFEDLDSSATIQNLKFLADNIFVTSDGYIGVINSSKFKLDSNVNMFSQMKNYPVCLSAGFDKNSILSKTSDKVLYRFCCLDGTVTGKIEFNSDILAISASGNKIIVITGNNTTKTINLIDEADITKITIPSPKDPDNEPNLNGPDDNNKDDNTNPQSPNNDDDSITSEIHHIDNENHIISDIPVGTTFAEFKNNLVFNGYSLVFKDKTGKIKTGNSTKIGTGYTVTFIKDGVEKTSFKLIVQGDITGTGTLTSRDVSSFVDYLLGKSTLDSASLQAANINDDNEADVIDLFLMCKMLQK